MVPVLVSGMWCGGLEWGGVGEEWWQGVVEGRNRRSRRGEGEMGMRDGEKGERGESGKVRGGERRSECQVGSVRAFIDG